MSTPQDLCSQTIHPTTTKVTSWYQAIPLVMATLARIVGKTDRYNGDVGQQLGDLYVYIGRQ